MSLCKEIGNATGVDIFVYEHYSTGNFHQGKAGGNGVCLQFRSLLSGKSYYAIFNVNLTRRRTYGSKKAGSLLPQKQFWVTKNMAFYRFWITTGLKVPPRLSSFHDYMGHLKKIMFTAKYREDGRIQKHTLTPACITQQAVRSAILTDNHRTATEQLPDNCQTTYPDKHSLAGEARRGLQLVHATGTKEHGNKVIRERGKTVSSYPVVPHSQHSTDDWDADYDATAPLTPIQHL